MAAAGVPSGGARAPERPPWFAHSMTPIEPYAKVGNVMTSTAVKSKHTVPRGASENIGGLSEINTGTTVTSYKPSFGVPRREHRRKGYFRTEDWAGPRKAARQPQEPTNTRKNHVLGEKPHIPQYEQGMSGQFTNGFQARSVTYPLTYGQGKDHVWERVDALPDVYRDELETRKMFQATILEDAKRLRAKKEDERAEKMKTNYGGTIVNQRQKIRRNHKRTNLDTQLKRHEESITSGTDMSRWVGKPGCGAALLNEDGSKMTNVGAELETHMHNAYSGVSMRNMNASELFDPAHAEMKPIYRKALDEQVRTMQEYRSQVRARSAERVELDDGGMAAFGKPGGGGPIINPDGSYRSKRPAGQTHREKKRDPKLAMELKRQRKEQRKQRKAERDGAMFTDVDFSPWGTDKRGQAASFARVAHKERGEMVEGASIVNQKTFGTAGGGAPTLDLSSDAPKVLDGSRSIEQVEARMELEAQAKGQSVWGRAGAGAPIRHEDGSINPHVRGRAEHDKDEVNDFRQNAAFKQRILVLAEQQGQALRDSEVRKKQDIAAEKKLDSTRLMSLKLQDDAEKFKTNMSAYTGERRFVKEGNMKDLQPKLFYTPLVKKDIAGLQLQIEAKKESQKREQALKLKEEAIHNSVADFAEVNTQRTAARMRDPKRHRDPILHVEEDAAKGMSNSTPAEKEALANALGNRIKERAALKKANRQKRRQDELAHSKASNKIFGPQSDHGFNETRQHDPLDYEYKMLVQKSSNLV